MILEFFDWLFRRKPRPTLERPSASDIVPRRNITHWDNKITISLESLAIPFAKPPKIFIPEIPNTNSMDPTFDTGHNNILVAGQDDEEQRIMLRWLEIQLPGNIIVFQIDNPRYTHAIHRIIRVHQESRDAKSFYYTTKGDNNDYEDPLPVWSGVVEWVSLGTIH